MLLEVISKAIGTYNSAKKNKLKAAQIHSRKVTHYEVCIPCVYKGIHTNCVYQALEEMC